MKTQQKIIDVASRLFSDRGYDGVSVRDITAEAGVNLGAITYHFGSKESLFAAIIIQKIQPLMGIGLEVSQSDASPKEKLEKLLRDSLMHILHHDPTLKVFFAEALQGGERLPAEAVQSISSRTQLISSIIQEGIDEGVFRQCDTESAAWIFFGMLVPYVLHEPLINPEHRRGPYPLEFVTRIMDQALEIFFRGIMI